MAADTATGSLHRFWAALSYALSELCLILLLQVAALASYAATRVAGVRGLRAPCTLCSRLDAALLGKPWFSADLVCPAHRAEIADLEYCTGRLVAEDNDLCNGCCTEDGVRRKKSSRASSSRASRCGRSCCCSEPVLKNPRKKLSEDAEGAESPSYKNADASDSTLVMPAPLVVVSAAGQQVPAADHHHHHQLNEISEIHASDSSPAGRDENVGASSANTGAAAAKVAAAATATLSSAPSRIFVDRNSSVKNAFIGRLNLPSPRPSEIIFARDNTSTTHQQVKALLTQISSRGLDTSPSSEGKATTPSPAGITSVQLPSAERSYSATEPSSDGNLGGGDNNPEGDTSSSSVESDLRRQLELSRKSLAALYKELEEERSASAVAASQTMAMINRLQEEKAAMQMEALQYLRMMEEQADHDHEAIQNLHDLLTDREKELLDLDAELANCRRLLLQNNNNDEPAAGTMVMNGDGGGGRSNAAAAAFEFVDDGDEADFAGSTMAYFEDEKAYILESLSRLQEDLGISTSRLTSDNDDARNSQDKGMMMLQEEDQTRENTTQLDSPTCSRMNDVQSVKNAILQLRARLKTLEVDQKFIKEVLRSLTYGSDGLQCVQEVISHLAELRTVVTQRRAMALPLVHTVWS